MATMCASRMAVILCSLLLSQHEFCLASERGEQEREIFVPEVHRDVNFNNCSEIWCFDRSRQSEHWIVFWDILYGTNDPASDAVPSEYRVDVDDVLASAEAFYALNVDVLAFGNAGNSHADRYKMLVYLYYTTDWRAEGGGWDDTIGALWISPPTSQPVGNTLAHEVGHCFQYQIGCDKGVPRFGFRWGFGAGGSGGNTYWEQTAQWQAHQSYPRELFGGNWRYYFDVYLDHAHRHFQHEDMRYSSFFLHFYWEHTHGVDFQGRLWNEAVFPEDAIQVYMRVAGISLPEFYAELYDAAARFVTWDLDPIRELGANDIGVQKWEGEQLGASHYRVTYERCPGTTGYNVIRLKVPSTGAGSVVSTRFQGVPNAPGFNPVDASRAGWRYGYVALLDDQTTRVYSPMFDDSSQVVSFQLPTGCTNAETCRIWFVISASPLTYAAHEWDDDNSNDDQWPYEVTFTNTDWFGEDTKATNESSSPDYNELPSRYEIDRSAMPFEKY